MTFLGFLKKIEMSIIVNCVFEVMTEHTHFHFYSTGKQEMQVSS